MKTLVIIKHELYDVLSNKKYMAGFIIQLLLLLTIVPIFGSYVAQGELGISPPTMKGFVPVGVVDHSNKGPILKQQLLENERLDIRYFDSYPSEQLKKGEICAVIEIPEGYDEHSTKQLSVFLTLDQSSLKQASAYDAVTKSIKKAGMLISEKRKRNFKVEVTEPIKLNRELLKPVVIEKEGSKFSSFFIGYLIPLILFFPIFMSGGLIVDSIVGEKERKTLETLLATPIHHSTVAIGKFFAIFGFITFQCFLWLGLLYIQGIPIANPYGVFILLAAVNSAVISTAVLLAVYSKSVKEANITLMILYTVVFMVLIISLSLEYFKPYTFFEVSPFVCISRLGVGDSVSMLSILSLLLLLSLYSLLMVSLSARLLNRDDIVFGPRVSLFELFTDTIEWLLLRFESRVFACSIVAIISGGTSVISSAIVEVALGILILYFLGYTLISIFLMVFAFALVEEVMKPLALFSVAQRKPGWIKKAREGFFYGSISGLGFFLFESLFAALLFFSQFPGLIIKILSLRIGTTLFIHALSSGIVGIGISRLGRGEKGLFFLLLITAALIHGVYNLVVFWVVI